MLYPFGGRDTNRINDSGQWDAASQMASCTDNDKGTVFPVTAGIGCTARVIAEGYKINY